MAPVRLLSAHASSGLMLDAQFWAVVGPLSLAGLLVSIVALGAVVMVATRQGRLQ